MLHMRMIPMNCVYWKHLVESRFYGEIGTPIFGSMCVRYAVWTVTYITIHRVPTVLVTPPQSLWAAFACCILWSVVLRMDAKSMYTVNVFIPCSSHTSMCSYMCRVWNLCVNTSQEPWVCLYTIYLWHTTLCILTSLQLPRAMTTGSRAIHIDSISQSKMYGFIREFNNNLSFMTFGEVISELNNEYSLVWLEMLRDTVTAVSGNGHSTDCTSWRPLMFVGDECLFGCNTLRPGQDGRNFGRRYFQIQIL